MAVPQDVDARRYYRVALQRMDDGKLILDQLERPTAAIYLAGYATECILKSLLIVSTPDNQRGELVTQFTGRRGHDLEWLRRQLRMQNVPLPRDVVRDFTYLTTLVNEHAIRSIDRQSTRRRSIHAVDRSLGALGAREVMNMATIRGHSDPIIEALRRALEIYEQQHPDARAELYRQNSASVRVRVVDPAFARQNRGDRHDQLWEFLAAQAGEEAVADVSVLLPLTPDELSRSFANHDFEHPMRSEL